MQINVIYALMPEKLHNMQYKSLNIYAGAKGDWDFRISDLIKNPNGIDI